MWRGAKQESKHLSPHPNTNNKESNLKKSNNQPQKYNTNQHLNHPKTEVPQTLFLKRFKAFAIDLFMIYTPILYVMTYVVLGNKEAFQENQWAIFICVLLYGIIDSLFCCVASQTPGMRAQSLVLKDSKGKNVFFFIALFRFFAWLFSLGLVFGFVFPFLRKDRKAFHDFICCTNIVEKPQ